MTYYRSVPHSVDALIIKSVTICAEGEGWHAVLLLENDETYIASPSQLARITPKEGDYLVIEGKGFANEYVVSKSAFEAKYEALAAYSEGTFEECYTNCALQLSRDMEQDLAALCINRT